MGITIEDNLQSLHNPVHSGMMKNLHRRNAAGMLVTQPVRSGYKWVVDGT